MITYTFWSYVVLKNAPKNIPGDDNQNVPTAYNTDIMEQAKVSEELRGHTIHIDAPLL